MMNGEKDCRLNKSELKKRYQQYRDDIKNGIKKVTVIPPRYDDIYWDGVRELDNLDKEGEQ